MREKKTIVTIAALLFIGGGVMWMFADQNKDQIEPTVLTQEGATKPDIAKEEKINESFPIVLSGAVDRPGIYKINEPLYLYEVLEIAGGLSEHAAASHLDQVFLVDRPITLYIPSKTDVQTLDEKQLFSHGYVPLIYIASTQLVTDEENQKININLADKKELTLLPGIGDVTAQNIINHREKNGDFDSIDMIMQVSGIKQARFEAIKDYICV